MKKTVFQNQDGASIVSVLLVAALSAFAIASALNFSSSMLRTKHSSRQATERAYEVEHTLAEAVAWLRENSQNMLSPFHRSNFYQTFRKPNISIGRNDRRVQVPSRLKYLRPRRNRPSLQETAVLTVERRLAIARFPNTINLINQRGFNPIRQFRLDDRRGRFGNALLRITLVDALPNNPSGDFGPPPAAVPQTDFKPVYRVDALTEVNQGGHLLGHILTELEYKKNAGFYGRNLTRIRVDCDSYNSALGAYSSVRRTANCTLGSNNRVDVLNGAKIYGSVRSNRSIRIRNSFVCADFQRGCPNPGETCSGTTCKVPGVPRIPNWNQLCPENQGNLNINANRTLRVSSNRSRDRCWNTVTIRRGVTLTLETTQYDYYFRTLRFENRNTSRLQILPTPNTGTIELYVNDIRRRRELNGNIILNSNRPSQFRLYYLRGGSLRINGNSNVSLVLRAPRARVILSGNHNFFGSIEANRLEASGRVLLHYDESLQRDELVDLALKVEQVQQIVQR